MEGYLSEVTLTFNPNVLNCSFCFFSHSIISLEYMSTFLLYYIFMSGVSFGSGGDGSPKSSSSSSVLFTIIPDSSLS